MSRSSRPRVGGPWLVPLAVLCLLVGACGGVVGSGSGDDLPDDANPRPTLGAASLPDGEDAGQDHDAPAGPSTASGSGPAPLDPSDRTALEQQWAHKRATVAANLSAVVYGLDDDGSLVGPGGLRVDLDQCPGDWDDQAGLSDETVTLAVTVARSGPLARYGDLVDGMQVYFDQVNADGGIGGRSIRLEVLDDGYDAATAAAAVDARLEEPEPFYVTTVGTPGSLAVRGILNDACVPQPLVVSSHPAWGDPEHFPFTAGLQRAQSTEALLWGAWIEERLDGFGPLTVALVAIDNDLGQIYVDTVTAWAETVPDLVENVVVVRPRPGDGADVVSDELSRRLGTASGEGVASAAPAAETGEGAETGDGTDGDDPGPGGESPAGAAQVVLAVSSGDGCATTLAALQADHLADRADARFVSSDCLASIDPPGGGRLGAAAEEGEPDVARGFLSIGTGLASTNDPSLAREPFVRMVQGALTDAGLDPADELAAVGYAQYGWSHVELLRLAARLPGGLRRSNVVLAMRSLQLDHPLLVDGVELSTNGLDDPYPVEGGEVLAWSRTDGGWMPTGLVLDIDGSTPACAWRLGACAPGGPDFGAGGFDGPLD